MTEKNDMEQHDREINEEIIRGYCANYDLCSDGCPIFQDEDLHKLVCAVLVAGGHLSIDTQLAALDAFKSVLPAEDMTADQCGTCRFGENDCEDWPCIECVDYDEWMPHRAVRVKTRESGTTSEEEPPAKPDMVAHPPHYTAGKVECIDAIESAIHAMQGERAFLTGQVIKYCWRWPMKGGVEDLRKAAWYLDRLSRFVESCEVEKGGIR